MAQSSAETTAANAWVDSYLNALLTFGLSSEYVSTTKEGSGKAPDADRHMYSRYYVRSLLKLDEEALKNAWSKAASGTKHGGSKDARLQYLSWRIWHLKRRHAEVERLKAGPEPLEGLQYGMSPTEPVSREYSSDEDGSGGEPHRSRCSPRVKEASIPAPATIGAAFEAAGMPALGKLSVKVRESPVAEGSAIDALFEDYMLSPHETTPLAPQLETPRLDRYYVVMISLHGLVRGERMELGRDSDTGGQVKYVVELARAMALHPSVYRVDLLTRMIKDPSVASDYGEAEECLSKGRSGLGGAYIVRLPCGPTEQYIQKEQLWPHVREFADRGIAHVRRMLRTLADNGRRCELYCVHGHYADAGEVAVLMASTLDVQMAMTGHSLGRNKLEHLLSSNTMTRVDIEATYRISRRIEAEEKCLDVAAMVFTSTQQEVDEQWGLYDGYAPTLARILRFRRSYGRHMPCMKVSPPGLDFSTLKVKIPEDPVLKEFEQQRAALAEMDLVPLSPSENPTEGKSQQEEMPSVSTQHAKGSGTPAMSPTAVVAVGESPFQPLGSRLADIIPNGPPMWQEIARFLRNPLKPAVLAMSRPDAKKNITTLVKAFGEHAMLRELANLVLIMGNRNTIDSMASGSQKVLTQVLKLIDAHDLYGSVAYPKHHTQADISDIYLFAHHTRGVFVNIALQEPFGLTVIEAAAHGVPCVATRNGGPVDIMATLHHGVVVEPTDADAVAHALLAILAAPKTWDKMATSGVNNIMAYSWPAHCKRYMESMDAERRLSRQPRHHDRTMSGLLDKQLSRLDQLGIADTETTSASGHTEIGPGDMQRRFSMPAEVVTAGALPGASPGSPSPRVVGRKVSGLTVDDLDILQGLQAEGVARRAMSEESAAGRKHFVVVPLDSDKVLDDVVSVLKDITTELKAAGLVDMVGVGILSMLGFDSTHDHFLDRDFDPGALDFMVCNAGADVWFQNQGGRWDADEGYESLIEFHWDRIALHRTLKKVISAPAENHRRLPRLKELLYNVAEAPEAGVHPHHICVELDPETQNILASGMGPKVRSTPSVMLATRVTERLKRRMRTKGFRANYTLQIVPSRGAAEDQVAVLHITPVRASRPLALRAIAHRLGLPIEAFTLILPTDVRGTSVADAVVYQATNDTPDLISGALNVFVAKEINAGENAGKKAEQSMSAELAPYQDVSRVRLVDRKNAVKSLVESIASLDFDGNDL